MVTRTTAGFVCDKHDEWTEMNKHETTSFGYAWKYLSIQQRVPASGCYKRHTHRKLADDACFDVLNVSRLSRHKNHKRKIIIAHYHTHASANANAQFHTCYHVHVHNVATWHMGRKYLPCLPWHDDKIS